MVEKAYLREQITLPGLSFKGREFAYVKILSEISKSERVDEQSDKRKPAFVCKVLNLQDGEKYTLICPALMVSAFTDVTEDYVGNCYLIHVSRKRVTGKQYKNVSIWEIDESHDYTNEPIREPDEKPKS